MTNRDVDQAVAALASRQHQLFSRRQALDLGASRSLIDRRQRAGLWPQEGPGVHGVAGATHTWKRRLMLAHLDLGPESVISHRAAAALHGVPNARRGSPELTIPRSVARSRRWRVHQAEVPPGDRTRVDRIPVTTLTRTVLDLSAVWPGPQLRRTVEELLIANRLKLDPFAKRVTANKRSGRPGSLMLATMIEFLATGPVLPASELEAKLFEVLEAAGLPAPIRQFPLPSITSEGRVDGAYPLFRLIIEVDGRRWHARMKDFEKDRRRDIEASMLGWKVLRFTWTDIVEDPQWVCMVIATHLRMAA